MTNARQNCLLNYAHYKWVKGTPDKNRNRQAPFSQTIACCNCSYLPEKEYRMKATTNITGGEKLTMTFKEVVFSAALVSGLQ